MGNNNNNKVPKKVPTAPAAAPAEPNNKVAVLDMTNFAKNVQTTSTEGLDPNRRVDLLRMLHETFRMDVNAAERYNMSPEAVAKINEISAIGQIAALACEIVYAKNPFAIRMSISQLEAIKEVGASVGVSIDTKSLPAPKENGTVEVPAAAIKVDSETKEKIESETAIREKEVELDPTKIENEEQLIDAIKQIMVTRDSAFQKINESLNFYVAYLKVKAAKSKDKNELKKIEETSRVDLLKSVAKLIGACPLVLNGVGRYMHSVTASSKSPIPAFCMFRNTTKNKKTGAYALTDEEVADYVRTLISWANDVKVEEEKKRIEGLKKNLEVLKKDEKKNAKAIEDTNTRIATCETNLNHFAEVLSYVMDPTADVPEHLVENYVAKDTVAMRTFKAITDSYYDEYNLKELKPDIIRHNVRQYAGIITNLFRDPSARLDQYSESNLMQLETASSGGAPAETPAKPEEKKDEKPAEEPKKE